MNNLIYNYKQFESEYHTRFNRIGVTRLMEDCSNRYNANRALIEEKFTTAYIQKMYSQLHKMTRTQQWTAERYKDHLWNAYVIAYWPPQTIQRAPMNSYGHIAYRNDYDLHATYYNEHAYTGDNYDG